MTGALKNQLGFLSVGEKRRLHFLRNVHKVIAELNCVIRPDWYLIDAVQTTVNTNEIRHGGRLAALGYMLAGTDPVSLDALGLALLQEVEPRLRSKGFADIKHLKNAVGLGVGDPQYQIIEL